MNGKMLRELMPDAPLWELPFEVELVAAGRGLAENLPEHRKIALLR